MVKNHTFVIVLRAIGVYLVIHNLISLLDVGIISFSVIGNVEGLTSYILGLIPYFIMLLAGISLLPAAGILEKKIYEKTEKPSLESTLIGLLLVVSSISSTIHLFSGMVRSYLSVRSLFHENAEIYAVLINTFYLNGIELFFFILEYMAGLFILMGWSQKLKYFSRREGHNSD